MVKCGKAHHHSRGLMCYSHTAHPQIRHIACFRVAEGRERDFSSLICHSTGLPRAECSSSSINSTLLPPAPWPKTNASLAAGDRGLNLQLLALQQEEEKGMTGLPPCSMPPMFSLGWPGTEHSPLPPLLHPFFCHNRNSHFAIWKVHSGMKISLFFFYLCQMEAFVLTINCQRNRCAWINDIYCIPQF